MSTERPTIGTVEERTAAVEVADRRIRGVIPFNVESRDLGGWTEVIEPTAFRDTDLSELRAVVDHAGVPLGRYPATLDVEDRSDGLHWSLLPPQSRADVVEAVERGDMKSGSWRMVVSRDRWVGDVRHVEAISSLRDVTIVGAQDPAYPDARVEYRTTSTGGERRQKGAEMDPQGTGAETAENENTENTEETRTEHVENVEERTEEQERGSLRVEQRSTRSVARTMTGLADEFRTAGFPAEVAEIPWQAFEDRAVTWSPSVNLLGQVDRQGGAFPVDGRYAWTALQRDPVDSAATSVQVLVQTAQSAATGVVRAIDATTNKAEIGTTVDLQTIPLLGVAGVASGIKNIILEQSAIGSIIENSLRSAINDGLDKVVNDTLAASGHQAPGSDNMIVSIRKSITTLEAGGFNPDTVLLDPASAEAIDLMVTGIDGGDADFLFAPALGPDRIFNLRRVVSKVIAAPVVLDSTAYGRLYASPARLARFEENAGRTNTSLVRLELNAACGVERQDAAVRIAAA